MNTNQSPIIVGLDIGTTKIVCIAAQRNEQGKINILGLGKVESAGIVHGELINMNSAVKSIHEAIRLCKKSCESYKLEIKEVYVGIAGGHIKTDETYEMLKRENPEEPITQIDLDILKDRVYKTDIGSNNQIISVISEGFFIDGTHLINNDEILGCTGRQLEAKFHIISGDKTKIRLMNSAVEKSGLTIKELFLQPLASKEAVTTSFDDEAGVAVLDIGGGTSDLAIISDKQFKHTSIIPFGGDNLTTEIKNLGMIRAQAEKLKIHYGTAIPLESQKNKYISIPTLDGLRGSEVNQYELAGVINKKMVVILDEINHKITDLELHNKLSYGIIITGGGAQLQGLKQLVEYKLGLNCRIGYPNIWVNVENNSSLDNEIKKPLYSTCIGLILLGFNMEFNNKIQQIYETEESEEFANIAEPLSENQINETNNQSSKINEQAASQPDKNKNEVKKRFSLLSSFKTGLLHLFSEEEKDAEF